MMLDLITVCDTGVTCNRRIGSIEFSFGCVISDSQSVGIFVSVGGVYIVYNILGIIVIIVRPSSLPFIVILIELVLIRSSFTTGSTERVLFQSVSLPFGIGSCSGTCMPLKEERCTGWLLGRFGGFIPFLDEIKMKEVFPVGRGQAAECD